MGDSSDISIRHLLLPLQISGLFPYTWNSHGNKGLTFSMRYFLWSVTASTLSLFAFLGSEPMLSLQDTAIVGNLALLVSASFTVIAFILVGLILSYRSRQLASVLRDPERKIFLAYSEEWTGIARLSIILFIVPNLSLFGYAVFTCLKYPEMMDFSEIMLICSSQMIVQTRILISISQFKKTLTLIPQTILNDVMETTSKSSQETNILSADYFTFQVPFFKGKCDGMQSKRLTDYPRHNSMKALHSLFLLQRRICKLQILRDDLTSYFFEAVTILLLVGLVGLTSGSFAVFRGNWVNGSSPLLASGSLVAILYLCNVGQNFERKIGKAVEVLQTFSSNVTEPEIKDQITRILLCLESLKEFDMCGWYKLDYSALVSCLSEVVTYIVILLQVGWKSVNFTESDVNNTTVT